VRELPNIDRPIVAVRVQPGAALRWDFDIGQWGGLRQAERSAAAGVLRSQDLVR